MMVAFHHRSTMEIHVRSIKNKSTARWVKPTQPATEEAWALRTCGQVFVENSPKSIASQGHSKPLMLRRQPLKLVDQHSHDWRFATCSQRTAPGATPWRLLASSRNQNHSRLWNVNLVASVLRSGMAFISEQAHKILSRKFVRVKNHWNLTKHFSAVRMRIPWWNDLTRYWCLDSIT